MSYLPNFGYLIPDKVAGSAHPGRGSALGETLDELRSMGFRGIVTVHERPLDRSMLGEFEIEGLHLPVADFSAPTLQQFERAVAFIDRHVAAGDRVLVHCLMGYGRTGTILAGYLVSKGEKAGAAIRRVRDLRPGSIEDSSQELAIEEFERHLGRRREKEKS